MFTFANSLFCKSKHGRWQIQGTLDACQRLGPSQQRAVVCKKCGPPGLLLTPCARVREKKRGKSVMNPLRETKNEST